MAKFIRKYSAELVSVEPVNAVVSEEWSWRLQYIGQRGSLSIMESEHRNKGQQFLYLLGNDGRYLKTSCGMAILQADTLIFETKQSTYIFRIIA